MNDEKKIIDPLSWTVDFSGPDSLLNTSPKQFRYLNNETIEPSNKKDILIKKNTNGQLINPINFSISTYPENTKFYIFYIDPSYGYIGPKIISKIPFTESPTISPTSSPTNTPEYVNLKFKFLYDKFITESSWEIKSTDRLIIKSTDRLIISRDKESFSPGQSSASSLNYKVNVSI